MRTNPPPIIEGDYVVLGESPPPAPYRPRTRRERLSAFWRGLPQPIRGLVESLSFWWLIGLLLLVGFAEGWS